MKQHKGEKIRNTNGVQFNILPKWNIHILLFLNSFFKENLTVAIENTRKFWDLWKTTQLFDQRTTLKQNTLTNIARQIKSADSNNVRPKKKHVLEKRVPCWTINSPVHTRWKNNRGNPETVTGFILAQNSKNNSVAVRRIKKSEANVSENPRRKLREKNWRIWWRCSRRCC